MSGISEVPRAIWHAAGGRMPVELYRLGIVAWAARPELIGAAEDQLGIGAALRGGAADIGIAALSMCRSVNAVSLSVGTHSSSLSDQICLHSAACIANFGLEFATSATLLFKGNTFLGMNLCLFEGGGVPGPNRSSTSASCRSTIWGRSSRR